MPFLKFHPLLADKPNAPFPDRRPAAAVYDRRIAAPLHNRRIVGTKCSAVIDRRYRGVVFRRFHA
jgi:hypothetical protein